MNGYRIVCEAINPIVKMQKHFFYGNQAQRILQTKGMIKNAELRILKVKKQLNNSIDEDQTQALYAELNNAENSLSDARHWYKKAKQDFVNKRDLYNRARKSAEEKNPNLFDKEPDVL